MYYKEITSRYIEYCGIRVVVIRFICHKWVDLSGTAKASEHWGGGGGVGVLTDISSVYEMYTTSKKKLKTKFPSLLRFILTIDGK